MTREEIERTARLGMRICWQGLEKTGQVKPLFAVWRRSTGKLVQFNMPEGTEQLMDHGKAKQMLFHLFRTLCQRDSDVEAFVFGGDTWRTDVDLKKHPDWTRYVDRGYETLEKMGWTKRTEAVIVMAQTREEVLLLNRAYIRREHPPRIVQAGDERADWLPQARFEGRLKMWGELTPETMGEHPDEQKTVAELDAELMEALRKL